MNSNSSETNFKRLNVVFHGAFMFVVRPDDIEVLIPKVPMHVYYAGSWTAGGLHHLKMDATYSLQLHEKTPRKDYPPGDFEKSKNLIFHKKPNTRCLPLIRLKLPRRPNDIKTLQSITVQRPYFYPRIERERDLGLVHVLTFELDGSRPSISGLGWTPLPGIDPSVANLHVFADPGYLMSDGDQSDHPEVAFKALMKLIGENSVFAYPQDDIPLVYPSNAGVVRGLGLRQIELASLSVSNLLPKKPMKKSMKKSMAEMDMDCRKPLNCLSVVTCPNGC